MEGTGERGQESNNVREKLTAKRLKFLWLKSSARIISIKDDRGAWGWKSSCVEIPEIFNRRIIMQHRRAKNDSVSRISKWCIIMSTVTWTIFSRRFIFHGSRLTYEKENTIHICNLQEIRGTMERDIAICSSLIRNTGYSPYPSF